MVQKLEKILQTLKLVNTRGDDSIIMAQCLMAIQQLINECGAEDKPVE